jgi:DNA repair protein RadC
MLNQFFYGGNMQQNLNLGHRKRVRERFFQEGINSFSDHQILEMMLFYSIQVKDTNKIAHKLLNQFGSLTGIFEANPKELEKVDGIGETSSFLLTMIPQIARRYYKDLSKKSLRKSILDSICAAEYAKSLFLGHTNEVFYLICLNAQLKVTHSALVFEGSINESVVYPRIVVETALRHQAASVILAHNHPGGSTRPSQADINVTQNLKRALEPISIKVNDHLIVAGNEIFSFAQNGLI